jgi:hypothetical protein
VSIYPVRISRGNQLAGPLHHYERDFGEGTMSRSNTSGLIHLLRITLGEPKKDTADADESTMLELKRRIILEIAELETAKTREAASASHF